MPSKLLISRLATEFKEKKILTRPDVFEFVKTNCGKEQSPNDRENWFYIRGGSVMRKVYFSGSIGVQALRKLYTVPKNRGVRPEHTRLAGGKIIRNILQQLERAELVEKDGKNGRKISSKGISFIDKLANEIKNEKLPHLSQY